MGSREFQGIFFSSCEHRETDAQLLCELKIKQAVISREVPLVTFLLGIDEDQSPSVLKSTAGLRVGRKEGQTLVLSGLLLIPPGPC